jgi:hypothetical protein
MRPEEGKNGASRRQPAFVFLPSRRVRGRAHRQTLGGHGK